MRKPFLPAAVTVLLALTPAAFSADQPTLSSAQAEFAAGRYRPALQQIAGALNGPDAGPGTQVRYDLLMLRGESMLRLDERRMAADAFRSAAAIAKSNQDPKAMAVPAATALLIQASRGTRYEPAAKGAEPIDIVDPESRKRAMAAFFADTLAADRPKIDQAMQANTLPPIERILPELKNLYILEVAATGEATQSLPLARAAGQRARDMLQAELARVSNRLDQLNAAANEPVLAASTIVPRGLMSPERDELKEAADSLVQTERAAQQGRWIAKQTNGPVESWDSILADCSELKARAQDLWDRRH